MGQYVFKLYHFFAVHSPVMDATLHLGKISCANKKDTRYKKLDLMLVYIAEH